VVIPGISEAGEQKHPEEQEVEENDEEWPTL
jgi:hypothetical protein